MEEELDELNSFQCSVCEKQKLREGSTDPDEEIFDLDRLLVCSECKDEYLDNFPPSAEDLRKDESTY